MPGNLFAGPPYQNFPMMMNPNQQMQMTPQQQAALQNLNIKSVILNDNNISQIKQPPNMFQMMPQSQGFPPMMNMNNQFPPNMNLNNMNNGMMPIMPNPMIQVKPEKSDALKKVFVNNIPHDVPDDFVESILRVFN